jgi:hypothetical protein
MECHLPAIRKERPRMSIYGNMEVPQEPAIDPGTPALGFVAPSVSQSITHRRSSLVAPMPLSDSQPNESKFGTFP